MPGPARAPAAPTLLALLLAAGCNGPLFVIGGPDGSIDGGSDNACMNGRRDGNETDVDCGGRCGGTCTFGQRCGGDLDCSVGACIMGACTPTGSTCFDHVADGPETDVDCGGGCPKCKDGARCAGADDCASGMCTAGRCAAGRPPFDFATARFADVKAQGPVALTAADLDGDGKVDVAVAAAQSKEIAVVLGNGDGTLGGLQRFSTGDAPGTVVAADWNRDGRLDLVAGTSIDRIAVFLGSAPGQGPFTMKPLPPQPACAGPRSVTPADLDGDGRTDLVVGCNGDGRVIGMRGNGDGTFLPDAAMNRLGQGLWAAVPGDFDRDGKIDAAAIADYKLALVRGDGMGGLAPVMGAMPGDAGAFPWTLVAADFDKDGRLDLATASYQGRVYGLRGRGDGTFQAPSAYNLGGSPSTLVAADMDGDGRTDLVVANPGASSLQLLRGRGDSTFEPAQGFYVGGTMQSVTVADFNGDGKPDMALCDFWTHDVGVLINRSGP